MLYKYGKRTRKFIGRFNFNFILVFYSLGEFLIKQLLLVLVGYDMIIANSTLRASLAVYHLISNAG